MDISTLDKYTHTHTYIYIFIIYIYTYRHTFFVYVPLPTKHTNPTRRGARQLLFLALRSCRQVATWSLHESWARPYRPLLYLDLQRPGCAQPWVGMTEGAPLASDQS